MDSYRPSEIKKVLILRFGAIGDVVHSTGLFRSLKKYNSEMSVHYITFKTPSLLIQNDPDLDKVWVAEKKDYKYLISLAKELREENFDLFINLQPSIRTKFLGLLTGAKRTLNYKKTFKLHAVENFWITAQNRFKELTLDEDLKLYISEEIKEKVREHLSADKIKVAFNMGVSLTRQGRRWPLKYWQMLAESLIDRYDCEILLTGSEEDKEFSEELFDLSINIKSFCGKLTIAETAALFSECDLVVSGDTGPLHIATAVGTKTIGLYGAAPISRTGPYGKDQHAIKSDLECSPCNKRRCKILEKGDIYSPCMLDIDSDRVLEVAKKLLTDTDNEVIA